MIKRLTEVAPTFASIIDQIYPIAWQQAIATQDRLSGKHYV
jgi:hypothetical protein